MENVSKKRKKQRLTLIETRAINMYPYRIKWIRGYYRDYDDKYCTLL